MKLPNVKKPCTGCPFRRDSMKGWLGEKRMTEILGIDSFVCHKKTSLQCAGHMLIKGDDNEFVRLAKSMDIETGLRGRDLVFKTKEDCIAHHAG